VSHAAAWLAVAALVTAVGAASTPAQAKPAVTVRVVARDYSFTLSRRSVATGSTVRFVVRNAGSSVHDFVVHGHRTRLLARGRSQTITVRFARKGTFTYLCSVPGHARLGMKGTFSVGTRAVLPPTPPRPPPVTVSGSAVLTQVVTTERPVWVTSPPGEADRIFVVDQEGVIWIVEKGQLREKVHFSSEPGLLSMAFSPDYAQSGLFYLVYNANSGNGDLRLSEFRRDATNPDRAEQYSERVVLTIRKPWENHNGGMLEFGPDGDLYMSVGDGDSGVLDPPGFFAQSRDDLLGDILRIDPRHGDPYTVPPENPFVGVDAVRPEIWAYGLRNPWRFWLDPDTGDMYIGDAGEGTREEIDLVPKGTSGQNFGWPCFEGAVPFDTKAQCASPVPPLIDIPHSGEVCAVIGGVVARDPRIPALTSRYLYGDYCGGKIETAEVENGKVVASQDLGLVVPELTSFGLDGVGRIYATSLTGVVYRLDPKV
jgi:glucose/arabinose dehydrogenase